MFDTTKLQCLKLADESLAAPLDEVYDEIETVAQQASQGWGLSRGDSVKFRMALEIKALATEAMEADELRRKVKGLQLENGRLKKRLGADD